MWRWVKSGNIKTSVTLGGQYRISEGNLEAFIVENQVYPLLSNSSSKEKILVVDDDIQIQEVFTKLLSLNGYQTEVASDGFEAGVRSMSFKPNLILLDLHMPGIDGFEVCRKVKENPATAHIKILAITGYDSDENRDRIMGAGADDYLAKPVSGTTLIKHVENLFSGLRKSVGAGNAQKN
ncbi:MAG: response regulator [Chlorobium phaeobacteroides]|nr:response regulator [Chlorobium phaeobacteroides]